MREKERKTKDQRNVPATVEELYRNQSRRIFATLIRLIGDFDLAEEALQEAFATAQEKWTKDGIPTNPSAWIVSTARFKAIDTMRRLALYDKSIEQPEELLSDATTQMEEPDEAVFNDDLLRLIFTCCHPALASNAQIALTLREICGLTTEEIASAFLSSPATIAQRIVRAKAKIRETKIPYEVPSMTELPDRLDAVLSVIYLVFNEGYSATSGNSATRPDLSNQAIRLGRVLVELLPDAEVMGLLALLLLHESRRVSRTDDAGDLILLENQDRSRWNQEMINEGKQLVERALATRTFGVYTLQAAISSVHASSASAEVTDWGRIVALYDLLLIAEPSPVVALNRAVAVAMNEGPSSGLQLIESIMLEGGLEDYHLIHAAKADLCRRLGKTEQARASYERALSLAQQEPERRFLNKRLKELT